MRCVGTACALADTGQVLLKRQRDALAKGHWKVALRQFFMLEQMGVLVPQDQKSRLQSLMNSCNARELTRMRSDAHSWAQLVRSWDNVRTKAAEHPGYGLFYAIARPPSFRPGAKPRQ